MTATQRPEVGTIADKLQEAVIQEGLIDAMPDRFWNELVVNGIETVKQFKAALAGEYSSAAEFSKELCEERGYLSEFPTWLYSSINWEDVWYGTLQSDHFMVEGKHPGDYFFFSRLCSVCGHRLYS